MKFSIRDVATHIAW